MILVGAIEKEYDVKKLLDGIVPGAQRRARKTQSNTESTYIENYYEGHDMSVNQTIGDNNRNVSIAFGKNINQAAAETIQNSFNHADQAKSVELQSLLKELAQEVAKIAEEQPAEKAQETADHLESVTKQATAEKRSKSIWEFSKKGIIDAAQAVGAVGSTAIKLVDQISKLLT